MLTWKSVQASSTRALIWLGCQGALAAARLAYWVFDPSFDESTVIDPEYVRLIVTGSERFLFESIFSSSSAVHNPGANSPDTCVTASLCVNAGDLGLF